MKRIASIIKNLRLLYLIPYAIVGGIVCAIAELISDELGEWVSWKVLGL